MKLIDTNILVYAHNADSDFNTVAKQLIIDALEEKIDICLTPQNLIEFFSIITNPKRVENNIHEIYTKDVTHFSKFPNITVIDPFI